MIIDPDANELVQLVSELNASIHNGRVIISVRKDLKSFLGVHLSPARAREVARHILVLANEIDGRDPG